MMIFQWTVETDLRKNVQQLTDTVHDKSVAIQNLQANVKRDEAEIQRLDTERKRLTGILETNKIEISQLQKDLKKTEEENKKNLEASQTFKSAFETANENVKVANANIATLDHQLKQMISDRSRVV